jgi:hypothetical protein
LEDVKDKFLVQSTIAPPDTREVGADTFDPASNKTIRQTKLRVLLVSSHLHVSLVSRCATGAVAPSSTLAHIGIMCELRNLPLWTHVQVGPPKPPSPVPEGIEEEASPVKVAAYKDDSSSVAPDPYAQERTRLRADLQKVCGHSAACGSAMLNWQPRRVVNQTFSTAIRLPLLGLGACAGRGL